MAAYEEQEYHKPFMLKVWAKMLPFFKPYKKYFAITLGLNIFLAGVDVLTPLFQSYAIDHFIVPDTLEGISVFAFAYISMIVMQTISVYWSVHAATTIEMCVGKDLKWAQFEHLQTLSFSYYNTTPVGYIHARVMSDTLKIAGVAAWGLVDMFWAFLYVVSVLLADLISCQANIERVMDLLEQTPDVTDRIDVIEKYGDNFRPRKENWENIKGDIVFEDVSFRYPDGKEYVLEHFNLHIPAGMNVAIVGETGAGKSTLVNLVGRFFEPTKGRILIDGVDYRERSQLWLHSQIGYVLQNPHLFSGTVRENIRYGRLDATDEEVEAAARSVSADEIVKKLKDGYDSDVGESGGRLSVGEKQLISFARAILAEPAIFVLDEATSSIDTVSEQLIQEATDKLLKGHTSFVIAHRLSTIRKADLILVVKDGKIIEQGTHAELLGGKGYYHDLYYKQFEEESARKVFAGDM